MDSVVKSGQENMSVCGIALFGGWRGLKAEGQHNTGGRALPGRACGCIGRQDGITSEWFSL